MHWSHSFFSDRTCLTFDFYHQEGEGQQLHEITTTIKFSSNLHTTLVILIPRTPSKQLSERTFIIRTAEIQEHESLLPLQTQLAIADLCWPCQKCPDSKRNEYKESSLQQTFIMFESVLESKPIVLCFVLLYHGDLIKLHTFQRPLNNQTHVCVNALTHKEEQLRSPFFFPWRTLVNRVFF